jgi:hypothetical protein
VRIGQIRTKAIWSRRYLGCVFCSLMYRYEIQFSESVPEWDFVQSAQPG